MGFNACREELGSLLRETCLALRLLQKKPPQPALLSNWAKFLDPASRSPAFSHTCFSKAPWPCKPYPYQAVGDKQSPSDTTSLMIPWAFDRQSGCSMPSP